MARKHIWQFLLTDEGLPVSDADIYITAAGVPAVVAATGVTVFASEVGVTGVNTQPQTNTSSKGYFEFWADTTVDGGYSAADKFRISWSKAGVTSGYIDYVEFFSDTNTTAGVSQSAVAYRSNYGLLVDSALDRVYLVSENLAATWTDHVDSQWDDPTPMHGLAVVNDADTNADKNKTVSNLLAKSWTDHNGLDYSETPHGLAPATDGGVQNDLIKNKLISDDQAFQWSSAAPAYAAVDETDTNATKDKVVSNLLAKGWEDHKSSVYSANPHGFLPVDDISSNADVNKVVSNVLAKSWTDGVATVATIASDVTDLQNKEPIQVITYTSGLAQTWTRPVGLKSMELWLVAGGGGGKYGSDRDGGGGGGGIYAFLTAANLTGAGIGTGNDLTINVGTGGTGGTVGVPAGTSGGDTSIFDPVNNLVLTAAGGAAGGSTGDGGTYSTTVAGGVGSTVMLGFKGGDGAFADSGNGFGGAGAGPFGGASVVANKTTGTNQTGNLYGGGGSGSWSSGKDGGDGAAGVLVIKEYY